MKNTNRLRKPNLLVLIGCLFLSFIAMLIVGHNVRQNYEARAALEGETKLFQISHSIVLYQHLTESMATVAQYGWGSKQLMKFVSDSMRDNHGIKVMIAAPNGIAEYRFPEEAKGFSYIDFMSAPATGYKAGLARNTGNVQVAGPFFLSENVRAMAVLNPVYEGEGKFHRFWGFTVSLVDLNELLHDANFTSITRFGYRYSLYIDDRDSIKVLGGEDPSAISAKTSVVSDMNIGGTVWHLRVSYPVMVEDQIAGLCLLLLLIAGSVLISMLTEATRLLERSNYTDPLTGILNRRGFDSVLERFTHDRKLKSAYVVAIDLNNFKSFNDRYGHTVGDSLLRSFAKELEALAGKCGIISRNGGDEFQIFIRNPDDGWQGRLEDFLGKEHFFSHDGIRYEFNVSGGAALYPSMGTDFTDLYRKADAALYHTKVKHNKQRLTLFEEEMLYESREQMGFNFSDLAGGAPAAVLIYRNDDERKVMYANHECLSLFGCADMKEFLDLSGGSIRNLVHSRDAGWSELAMSRQQAGAASGQLGYIICRAMANNGIEKTLIILSRKMEHEYFGEIFYALLWDREDLHKLEKNRSVPVPEEIQSVRDRKAADGQPA
ncbi:MAG: diguanylate cyclase [Succinivibrionaceae bacterium]|nr:sensor domain-containing diguanylate cyclase [Pseudomonadota bacterium]MDY3145058.1 diguanylate cyclase [Succinivibrionaceae bacterium]